MIVQAKLENIRMISLFFCSTVLLHACQRQRPFTLLWILTCAVLWYGQDPDHPRACMKEELKAWCQRHHCEALAQLAVFAPAREALQRDASVVPALEAVAAAGLSAEIREVAAAALMALSDKELEIKVEGQKHVMLSCVSIVSV